MDATESNAATSGSQAHSPVVRPARRNASREENSENEKASTSDFIQSVGPSKLVEGFSANEQETGVRDLLEKEGLMLPSTLAKKRNNILFPKAFLLNLPTSSKRPLKMA